MSDDDGPRVRRDLVYPELSYKIVGALFDVYNDLGPGHLERTYQQAVALAFKEKGIQFQEQLHIPVRFHQLSVGKKYLDFLVDEKIILELKQGDRFRRENIQQVNAYLQETKLKLAILANFTRNGVLFKRLINLPPDS